MMRHALVLLILPIAALADDPFECVDPDVVDAFVGNWYGDSPRYSTSLPADLANINLPAHFELVGSRINESSVMVAYTAEQDARAALSSSKESLKAAGWKEYKRDDSEDRGGFQTRAQSTQGSTLMCHQSAADALSILAKQQSGRTLLSLSVYPQHRLEECRDLSDSSEAHFDIPLQKYLPVLKVPADAEVHTNGSGGGGDEYSAGILLSTELSRDGLLRYFDDQIREQNWAPDSAWSGSSTAGTVWIRTGSNEELLIGTMRVAEVSANGFNARFTVISADPDNYFSGHSSSVRSD